MCSAGVGEANTVVSEVTENSSERDGKEMKNWRQVNDNDRAVKKVPSLCARRQNGVNLHQAMAVGTGV